VAERVAKGTWVELGRVVLAAGERAPQVPEETQAVPLEMRVKGVLTRHAVIGGQAEVRTSAGRTLRGRLERADPPYAHGFGPPIAELLAVGEELRARIRRR
jgi:hypothetical protein